MKDIDIAKELLQKENLTIAVVKDGEIVFTSKEKGIKPIYTAVKEFNEKLKGASAADRVVGKAAAMLYVHGNIKEFYTELISEAAVKILKQGNIIFTYTKEVPYIKNRNKTDMCPVEKLSQNINDSFTLLEKIEEFLEKIKEGA
jgi:hypothetical protein